MTQTTTHSIRHFREGFEEGRTREPSPTRLIALAILRDLFLVMLFGYLVASPGVPFLPWGEFGGIATGATAVVAITGARLAKPQWVGNLLAAAVVMACYAVTAQQDGVSTSLLLAGATVAAMTKTATALEEQGAPRFLLYGSVVGFFAMGWAFDSLGLIPLVGPDVELIFSGEQFTPDGAGRQMMLLAGAVLLAGLLKISEVEIRKQKERTGAAEAARDAAAADERARIARELHDVVSHHVTAMTLQAEAAAATGDRKALASLASSGREAAAELRRMLGVLRRPGTELKDIDVTDPQPRLDDLDDLAQRLTGGLQVNLDRTGRVRSLPAGVELCAFRVIQEALTNVAKHSDAREASVTVDYGADHLSLEVLDDGAHLRSAAADGDGHGLIGMRERVTLLDGTLAAGPREPGRGYRVFAQIPL